MDITRFCRDIDRIFFRAIDPDYRAFALSGSRLPGRHLVLFSWNHAPYSQVQLIE